MHHLIILVLSEPFEADLATSEWPQISKNYLDIQTQPKTKSWGLRDAIPILYVFQNMSLSMLSDKMFISTLYCRSVSWGSEMVEMVLRSPACSNTSSLPSTIETIHNFERGCSSENSGQLTSPRLHCSTAALQSAPWSKLRSLFLLMSSISSVPATRHTSTAQNI